VNCEEKKRLAFQHESAAANFSEAVADLRKKMSTSTKEIYQRLERAANEARVKSEQARLALEQHITSHRWLGSPAGVERPLTR